MFGWRGQLLRVDLDNGAITKEPLNLDVAKEYLGGRGLGAYLHGEEVPVSIAPLSAENHLLFITGPLDRHSRAQWRALHRRYADAAHRRNFGRQHQRKMGIGAEIRRL